MNKIFKNEDSVLGKIESLFWKLYNIEPLRFLFWGGINTLFTYIITLSFNGLFSLANWKKELFEIGNIKSIDIPYICAFVISIPFSYTTNAIFIFKQKWTWVRLARYPLSSIPNFLINLFGIWVFYSICGWPKFLAYLIAAILPLPIMFFINKFLVGPIKLNKNKQKKEKDDSTEIKK